MKASDVMTVDVERVSPDADLEEVAAKLWARGVGAVVVVDAAGQPVGIVTDRDVALAAFTDGRRLGDLHVSDVAAGPLVCCAPDDTLPALALSMRDQHVRRLVVVDTNGALCGIVSITDLARVASRGLQVLESPRIVRAAAAAGTR